MQFESYFVLCFHDYTFYGGPAVVPLHARKVRELTDAKLVKESELDILYTAQRKFGGLICRVSLCSYKNFNEPGVR